MATILAANNGNWSASGTWTSGIFPTSGDVVLTNNRTITVDINAVCLELRNAAISGATAGGGIVLSNGVTFSGNLILTGNGSLVSYTSTLNNSATIVGNAIFSNNISNQFNVSGPGTFNFIGNISGNVNSTTGAFGLQSSIANLNIVGNITNTTGGNSKLIAIRPGSSNLAIIGNIAGGIGGFNASATTISIDTSMSNITISGNITGGSSIIINEAGAKAIAIANPVTKIDIYGNILGGPTSAATLVQNNNVGLSIESLCGSINISGSVLGGNGTLTPAVVNFTATPININGNVIGGSAGSVSYGIQNSSNGIVTINGNVVGGLASVGAINGSTGSIIVNGTAIGGSGAVGVSNGSTGSVFATLAKGNAFGIGSSGVTHQVGVSNASFGPCYVSGIEFGDRGACPVFGPIQFLNSLDNTCSMYRPSGLSKKILLDVNNVSGLLPQTIDVRKNVVYNLGNNIGSLNMPSSGSVALGVPVDNTSGVAILSNPGQIWDYATSNISGVNSIGNRLKNCSTVENLGTQLSNALSSITP